MINRTKKRQELLKLKPADSAGGKTSFATNESLNVFKEISEETNHIPSKTFKSVRSNDLGKENATNINRKSIQPSPSKPKGNQVCFEIFSKLI